MVIDGETIGVMGAIIAPLLTTIGVLWTRNNKMQTDFDTYREKAQDRILEFSNKQTEFMGKSNQILETAQKTIDSLIAAVNTLKDELIRGKQG